MIVVSVINLIISTIIQSLISNYLGYTYQNLSIFFTIYTLISMLVIKPYIEDEKKYLIILVIFSFVIGITYTRAYFFNICLFLLCYLFTKLFHFLFPYNLLTINISTLFGIFIYHITTFIFFYLSKYGSCLYDTKLLFKVLYSSIIMTIIYTSINYCVLSFIKNKQMK